VPSQAEVDALRAEVDSLRQQLTTVRAEIKANDKPEAGPVVQMTPATKIG
jgi:capsule polysaccharide export protein KpsE/RkpR